MTFPLNTSIDRRRFLTLSGSTALASGLVGTGAATIASPVHAASHEWTLEITRPSDTVYQYNGKTTGPIISASAGETIVVNLINAMPPIDDVCPADGNMNQEHGANVTNLHTHGLHVSPVRSDNDQYDSDNVFLRVVPDGQIVGCGDPSNIRHGQNTFHFDLPSDHPPGTHWYHAHVHGSTARQVTGGLAGPLIIRDPDGWMPGYIAEAPERVFMISNGTAIEVETDGGGQSGNPIQLAPGAVERWRIINAEPRASSFVKIASTSSDVELWQIAYDGLTLDSRVMLTDEDEGEPWNSPGILAPGNRMDVMVRVLETAPTGPLALTAEKAPAQFLHVEDNLALADETVEIKIEVGGAADPKPWDAGDDLPGPMLKPITDVPVRTRDVHFEIGSNGFAINDQVFGEDPDPLFEMELDTVEEWELTNGNSGMHPFHIHVNPFYVTHINGEELGNDSPLRRWQDVIAIPGNGSIKFLTRFLDYKGKFVIHCHILAHEDRGMMRVVEVI